MLLVVMMKAVERIDAVLQLWMDLNSSNESKREKESCPNLKFKNISTTQQF